MLWCGEACLHVGSHISTPESCNINTKTWIRPIKIKAKNWTAYLAVDEAEHQSTRKDMLVLFGQLQKEQKDDLLDTRVITAKKRSPLSESNKGPSDDN